MPLREHLRELRSRALKAALGIVVGAVVGWFVYDPVFQALQAPVLEAEADGERTANLNFSDLAGAFDLKLQVSIFIGLIGASPIWIYQFWAFITPGLSRRERRYALAFVAVAVPLFLLGVFLAWRVLPQAVGFLFDFAVEGTTSFIDARQYLTFVMRLMLIFGVAFLLPVALVGLNFAHLLSARALGKSWRISVFLIFLFSAIATPSPDAVSMLALAFPMVGLFLLALGICLLNDRKRRRRSGEPDYEALGDDEASPL